MVTFTEGDLNVSQTEIDELKAALANAGVANALANTIAEQLAKVEDYTLRYQLSDERYRRLARSLILHRLYSLLGPVPSGHQVNYTEAMRELQDIRDGKFADLALDDPRPAGLAVPPGRWGSAGRID